MNKRNNVIAALMAGMLLLSSAVFADTSQIHGESIDTILSGIRSELNLGSTDAIEPDKVSDESLEKLGEAVMSFRIPDPRQHEWMDKMMGGEGSESLADMHKLMGYRYLENGSTDFGSMMMGSNMYGRGFGGTVMEGRFSGWMPGYRVWGYGWIFPLLFVVLIIAAAVLIIFLARRGRTQGISGTDPLTALKGKYVKGEIGRERVHEDEE